MKRLRKKAASLVKITFESLRRRRQITAEWVAGDINDPNLVQQITDMMATGGQMQIEYSGEWKTIEPYGWNSSKDGNVLLMCYKDTGEVRSYRLDRMTNVQFDSSVLDLSQYGLAPENEEEQVEEIDGVEVPTLDENENEFGTDDSQQQDTPFEGAIDVLEQVDDEFKVEDFRQLDSTDDFEPTTEDDFNPMEEQQPTEDQQIDDQMNNLPEDDFQQQQTF